jgi:uncharacterized protein YdeI (YjbR/CyaY-like superfamily)
VPISAAERALTWALVEPTFFATPDDFRKWLEAHHTDHSELLVGFHKVGSGRPSMTWPQSVDEALCFGWIDGVRRRIDDASYTIRFSPRKPTSTWSAVNVKRARELIDEGRMQPAGLAAFEARKENRTGIYSYENRPSELPTEYAAQLQANAVAAAFFADQPPSYRRAAIWWVISAKKEETRQRRLGQLIEDSASGRTVGTLTRPTERS